MLYNMHVCLVYVAQILIFTACRVLFDAF